MRPKVAGTLATRLTPFDPDARRVEGEGECGLETGGRNGRSWRRSSCLRVEGEEKGWFEHGVS